MNLVIASQRITADGSVGPVGTANVPRPIRLHSVTLKSGVSASTISLLDGLGLGGTELASVTGVASQGSVFNWAGGLRFPNGLYADVDANISYATLCYTEEY